MPASICNPLITKNRHVGAVKEHEAQAAEYGTFEGNTSGFCADLRSGKACGGETRPFLHRISGCLRYKSYLIIIIYHYILYMQRLLHEYEQHLHMSWAFFTFVSFLHGLCSTLRKRGQERTFFNLVLVKTASSGSSQTSKDTLRQLPPLEGPKVLPDAGNKDKGKGKGKGKTKKGKGQKQKGHSVGHWILLHHTPKILVKPDCKSSLLWWHPTEHAIWSRGWRSRLKNRKEEDEQWQAFSSIFSCV